MSNEVRAMHRALACFLFLIAGPVAPGRAQEEAAPADDLDTPPLAVRDFHEHDPQMGELIAILLEENPEILSARAASRSQWERVDQSRALPDPQFTYRHFLQTPETRVGPQEQALEVSQAVPWKGKRGLQADRAEAMAANSAWRVRELERSLVAELKRSYFQVAYLQEALTINEEEHDLLQRFEAIALRRYSTGEGIQQSVVKVQTDITRLGDVRSDLEQRLEVALQRIAELIGRPGSVPEIGRIDLQIAHLSPDPETLEEAAIAWHPRLRALERRIDADRALLRRRQLDSRPDFRFGLGYTVVDDREDPAGVSSPPEDNGQDILAVTVSVNLPIYRKRTHAGIAEAEEIRRSSESLLITSANRLRYMIRESLARIESLEERSRLHSEVLIPQAEESLASAEAAYTTGRLGSLDLLDAERILFQIRLNQKRLASDYWIAMSDLEFSIGERFPSDLPPLQEAIP